MQEFLVKLLLALLKMLPFWAKPKMQDGSGPGALEERLKAKIKKEGW